MPISVLMETRAHRGRAARTGGMAWEELRELIVAHRDWLAERASAHARLNARDRSEAGASEHWKASAATVELRITEFLQDQEAEANEFESAPRSDGAGNLRTAELDRHSGNGGPSAVSLAELQAWRHACLDLIDRKLPRRKDRRRFRDLIGRAFDRAEIESCKSSAGSILGEIHSMRDESRRLVFLEKALDSAEEMVVIADRAGRIEHVNDSFIRKTGYRRSEAIGEKLLKLGRHDPDLPIGLWQTVLEGQVWEGEFTNARRNGTPYPEWMRMTPIPDIDGEISHVVVIKRDLTERREAERREREARLYFEKLIEMIPVPVFAKDPYGVFTFCNAKFAELVRKDRDSVIGSTSYDLSMPDQARRHLEVDDQLLRDGGERDYLVEFVDSAGVTHRHRYSKGCVRGESNEVIGIVGVVDETTMEEAIRSIRAEASTETLRSLEQAITFLAHELHSPIASIQTSAEILQHPSTRETERRKFAELIRCEGASMRELVSDILDIARMADGRSGWNMETFDLRRVLERAIERNRFRADAVLGPRFECEIWDCDLQMEGNEPLIERMVVSLLENALEYTVDGSVRLSADTVERDGRPHILLQFDDTGPGIPQSILQSLDEPFSHSSGLLGPDRAQGAGLGMTFSQGVIQLHDGRWKIESDPESGTHIRVYLPVSQDELGRNE